MNTNYLFTSFVWRINCYFLFTFAVMFYGCIVCIFFEKIRPIKQKPFYMIVRFVHLCNACWLIVGVFTNNYTRLGWIRLFCHVISLFYFKT